MVDQVVINKETPEEPTPEKSVEEVKSENVKTESVDQPVEEQKQPEKILGKFDTQEDLAKAYEELESKLGSKVEKPKPTDQGLEIDQAAEKVVESAGLDMQSLEDEYAEHGELKEDSLKKLESVGISKDIVSNYIEGQKAVAQQIENDIKSIAGGNEGYSKMIAWAKDNLTPEEIAAYNRVANGRDLDATKMAVQGLKARMDGNAEPNLIQGRAALSQERFESVAQITEAMKDPRYEKDPAYREEVKQKISRSEVY